MPFNGRTLIHMFGGSLAPGETLKGYLRRISQELGIGFRSAEIAWRGYYCSKRTEKILQEAALGKVNNEIQRLIEDTVDQIFIWQAIDAGYYRPHIDAARAYITSLRTYQDAVDASLSPRAEAGGKSKEGD